ncbi:Zeaxanthin epoxidase [Scenedesmus sp. PABB004]|nr:Zeaxanthin epoxidase [Scenedesmus sp. PABB004]
MGEPAGGASRLWLLGGAHAAQAAGRRPCPACAAGGLWSTWCGFAPAGGTGLAHWDAQLCPTPLLRAVINATLALERGAEQLAMTPCDLWAHLRGRTTWIVGVLAAAARRGAGSRSGSAAARQQRQRRGPLRSGMTTRAQAAAAGGSGRGGKKTSVLFVCLGNICRSPSAEAVFRSVVDRAGLADAFDIDSCGTGGGSSNWYLPGGFSYHEGDESDPRMKATAAKRGVVLTSTSRPLRPADLARFDHIVGMDARNVRDILKAAGHWAAADGSLPGLDAVRAKTSLMTDYCSKFAGADEVPDPYYGGAAGFERVLDLLDDAAAGLLAHAAGRRPCPACAAGGLWSTWCGFAPAGGTGLAHWDAQLCPAPLLRAVINATLALERGAEQLAMTPCDLWAHLRGRTTWIVGDSMAKDLFRALRCFLLEFQDLRTHHASNNYTAMHALSAIPGDGQPWCAHMKQNTRLCQVHAVQGDLFVGSWARGNRTGPGVLRVLQDGLARADDVFVLHFALWHRASRRAQYEALLHALGRFVAARRSAFPHVFWMEMPKQHFADSPDGDFDEAWVGTRDGPWACRAVPGVSRGRDGAARAAPGDAVAAAVANGTWRNVAARDILSRQYGVPLVPIYNTTVAAWAWHRNNSKGTECSHFCMPSAPQLWLPVLRDALAAHGVRPVADPHARARQRARHAWGCAAVHDRDEGKLGDPSQPDAGRRGRARAGSAFWSDLWSSSSSSGGGGGGGDSALRQQLAALRASLERLQVQNKKLREQLAQRGGPTPAAVSERRQGREERQPQRRQQRPRQQVQAQAQQQSGPRRAQPPEWLFDEATLREKHAAAQQAALESLRASSDDVAAADGAAPDAKKQRADCPISVEDEAALTAYYAVKLKAICQQLQLPSKVLASSMTFFRRFYSQASCLEHDPNRIMPTCIYLACKVEEAYRSAEGLARSMGIEPAALLRSEVPLLQGLSFDLVVHSPYRALAGLLKELDELRGARSALLDGALLEAPAERLAAGGAKARAGLDVLMLTEAPLLQPPGLLAAAALRSGLRSVQLSCAQFLGHVARRALAASREQAAAAAAEQQGMQQQQQGQQGQRQGGQPPGDDAEAQAALLAGLGACDALAAAQAGADEAALQARAAEVDRTIKLWRKGLAAAAKDGRGSAPPPALVPAVGGAPFEARRTHRVAAHPRISGRPGRAPVAGMQARTAPCGGRLGGRRHAASPRGACTHVRAAGGGHLLPALPTPRPAPRAAGRSARRLVRAAMVADRPTAPANGNGAGGAAAQQRAPLRVIVAGAGIGGLVLAVALLKRGVDVKVYERDLTAIRGEGKYRGPIQVQSNALAALEAIDAGVAEEVLARGCITGDRINGLCDGETGDWYVKFDTFHPAVDKGLPVTRVISRVTLQEILADAVERLGGPEVIENSANVVGFEEVPRGHAGRDGVRVSLEDGRSDTADLLIGADGIYSKVRRELVGGGSPVYSGYTCYTGISDFTPPDLEIVGYRVFLGNGQYFVSSDVGGGKQQWYAFHKEPPGGTDPPGASRKARLLEIFGHWCEDVTDLIKATPEPDILRRDISDRPPIFSWARGRVALLGDSAHAMQPNLGQGGCMAIEDAFQLGEDVAAALAAVGGDAAALDVRRLWGTYQGSRLVRAAAIHGMARFAAIMASTYKAYLGEGLGPLSFIRDLHIPHPGRVVGRAVLGATMPAVLDWVLGGNNDRLAAARPSSCRIEDRLKVFSEAEFATFMRDDTELRRAAHARWLLLTERPPSCGSVDATSVTEAKGVVLAPGAPAAVVGSDARAAALLVAGGGAAGEHARVWRDERGDCFVQDLPASSGTWVNGRRLPPGEARGLRPGDVVEFGAHPAGEAYKVKMQHVSLDTGGLSGHAFTAIPVGAQTRAPAPVAASEAQLRRKPAARARAMGGRAILLTVEESPASDKVLEYAVSELYRSGDVIHILHIIAPSRRLVVTPDMGLEGVIEDDEETKRKVEQHAQDFIRERFERRLESLKVPFQVDIVRGCVDNDSIGALVCRRAEQVGAVAVVMAKHSRGAIKEFFVGSVTNYCAHHCKQPVLILHVD